MPRPKGSKNKSGTSASELPTADTNTSTGTSPSVSRDTSVNTQDLLKQLDEERAKRIAVESKWHEKEITEKKERDPMSGPGRICEAPKITLAESWQLGKEIFNTPDGRQDMRLKKCPEGFQVRPGTNGYYIVGLEKGKPEDNDYIPNCRSKYTQEYEYKTKKPAHYTIHQEPPKAKIHLCEHHAHVLLDKAECFCKFCKPPKRD